VWGCGLAVTGEAPGHGKDELGNGALSNAFFL
jgi:hypothetical protein